MHLTRCDLAVFAAEHFTAAQDLMRIVPSWLPSPLFWTYFVGAAWLAAAVSFIIWRLVHWSAPLVPLEKLTPAWVLFPVPLAYIVGLIQMLTGIGLFVRPTIRIAAATAGITLLLLTIFLYTPILALESNTDLAVEGLNYVFDTLLFAATALLAGFAQTTRDESKISRKANRKRR